MVDNLEVIISSIGYALVNFVIVIILYIFRLIEKKKIELLHQSLNDIKDENKKIVDLLTNPPTSQRNETCEPYEESLPPIDTHRDIILNNDYKIRIHN